MKMLKGPFPGLALVLLSTDRSYALTLQSPEAARQGHRVGINMGSCHTGPGTRCTT